VRDGRISGILELGGGFNSNLTGRQNLMTAGILNGLTPSQVKSREEKIIHFAEIDQFIDQPTRTYSSGMYLRLAFAAAIEFEPSILVLDEILAVGDERFQKKCIERITELKRAGTTLIVTSHSPEQIQALCDEVLVLEEGQVVMQGDPERALAAYHELLQQRTEARASGFMDSSRPSRLMTDQGHRQGTLEASISAVRLYDRNGEPVEKIASGEGLKIELEYRLADPHKDLALAVGIFTETRFKCSEAVVSSIKTTFGAALSSEGTIVCEIQALPLLDGKYFVNVGLYPTDWSYIYDSQWDMHSFHVYTTKRESFHISGAMAMDVMWTSLRKVMR
jgi:lipopolysaccharide transport system ATP-binding protein